MLQSAERLNPQDHLLSFGLQHSDAEWWEPDCELGPWLRGCGSWSPLGLIIQLFRNVQVLGGITWNLNIPWIKNSARKFRRISKRTRNFKFSLSENPFYKSRGAKLNNHQTTFCSRFWHFIFSNCLEPFIPGRGITDTPQIHEPVPAGPHVNIKNFSKAWEYRKL